MKMHLLFLAILLLAVSAFSMAAYPGNYPPKAGTGDTDSTIRLDMRIKISENCSGIYVQAVSHDDLGDGNGIPGVEISVIALPRDNILPVAGGTTDGQGIFAFNSSYPNMSIHASKVGYNAQTAEYFSKGVDCPKPPLGLDISYDCAKKGAKITVLSGGEPAPRASVSVNGADAGVTGSDGSLFFPLSGKSMVSVSLEGASAEKEFAPDCPSENASMNQTAPPPTAEGAAPQSPAPSGPQFDLPLIGAVVVILVAIYFLIRGGPRKIGPGPMKPNEIGPGPMKGKNQIGPGPMKNSSQIGPGPMKPKEIGPGPM